MSKELVWWSEEDLRTKVISQWLIGHGFSWNDLLLEFSFTIQLGRSRFEVGDGQIHRIRSDKRSTPPGALTLRPRADVLVRNSEGKNLLIIEAKAPDEPLDDDARDQGISYARLLLCGNIAPFVVLTNGRETKIFDSVTKEQIDGSVIPPDHPYVRAGFYVSGDDITLRAEALTSLISLSPENLVKFCQAQSERRMSLLRSEDLNSGKKYVPSLYVEREQASKKLAKLLDEQQPVVVLIGPPQIGKTNFICHTVEERLNGGGPCLFYPAVGMRDGLLAEIAGDFEWVMGESQSSCRQILIKLQSVLRRSGKKLVIFVDGWNEASLSLAQAIDRESELVCRDEIQIVISATSTALKRLLIGEAGNPSFIAQAASLDLPAIQLLEIDPDAGNRVKSLSAKQSTGICGNVDSSRQSWSVISLPKYSDDEISLAYKKYAEVYKVTVPNTHSKIAEPYTLGIAMRFFQGDSLPDKLDEPSLLETHIDDKINRAVGMKDYNSKMFLRELADEMYNESAPVPLKKAVERWGIPIVERPPSGLYEAALLTEVTIRQNEPGIDFYYGRERDFVIACWVRDWVTKAMERMDMNDEFTLAARSNAGLDALHWFLQQPAHMGLIESNDNGMPAFEDAQVRRALLAALCNLVTRGYGNRKLWLSYAMERAQNDSDTMVKIEAVKLVSLLADDEDELYAVLPEMDASLSDFIIELLALAEDVELKIGGVGQVILDAFRKMHVDTVYDGDLLSDSCISGALEELIDNDSETLRRRAADCFGYVAPGSFLRMIANKVKIGELMPGSPDAKAFESGFSFAVSELDDYYYGAYGCPGYMDSLEDNPEAKLEQYKSLEPILGPAIYFYHGSESARRLKGILNDLEVDDPEETGARPSLDLLTLPLPFDAQDQNE
jgi:hypothetical protein